MFPEVTGIPRTTPPPPCRVGQRFGGEGGGGRGIPAVLGGGGRGIAVARGGGGRGIPVVLSAALSKAKCGAAGALCCS